MRHIVIIIGTAIYFALNLALWIGRPSPLMWLAASALLGAVFMAAFFRYAMRE